MIDDEDDKDEERGGAPDATQVDSVLAQIRQHLSTWQEGEPIELPCGSWRPHLAAPGDNGGVLHIHLATRIRPYLAMRLREAAAAGRPVHVALELSALYDDDTVRLLGELDAQVHIVDENGTQEAQHVLTTIAIQQIPVSPAVRTQIATAAWERRGIGTNFERGRRFEGLLGFLLSQVVGFRVRERNLRGDTDELDIVVQINGVSLRCWVKSGSPFVLVEAKNTKEPVDQKEVSAFITKIQTRRGTARIGIVFGATGFTSDAETQVLKFSTQEYVIVLIGPEDLMKWIASENSDDFLEDLVRRAMLR